MDTVESHLPASTASGSSSRSSNSYSTSSRRHDLDALRAIAMLLGIWLHVAMAFVPGGWVVRDVSATPVVTILVAAVHAFRLPLFFLLSGYFTAMLWKRNGLRALIHQRVNRIFVPLLCGMVTVVPAIWAVSYVITQSPSATSATSADSTGSGSGSGKTTSINQRMLEAALEDDVDRVRDLLSQGANCNATDGRGSTAMHIACLFGRVDLANLLLDAGADPHIVNTDRSRPVDTLRVPWGLTKFYADLLKVSIDKEEVATGRQTIAERLGITISPDDSLSGAVGGYGWNWGVVTWFLFSFPLFHHLWFLWFLCWLLVGFVACVTIASKLKLPTLPPVWVLSGWRYLWLIPLVAVPQYFMSGFGPDTSQGLLPLPVVLAYYFIFFSFGALLFMAEQNECAHRSKWWNSFPIVLLVAIAILFPAGFGLMQSSDWSLRTLGALCGAAYTWMVCFGLMDAIKRFGNSESKAMRYVADSSYWLYFAHMPLVLYLQHIVKGWPINAAFKIAFMCAVVCGVLLLSYQWFVRYTAIGAMLNGPRHRPHHRQESLPVSEQAVKQ